MAIRARKKSGARERNGGWRTGKPVAAVERALRVLTTFRTAGGPLWLHEIADATGMFKSTILRLLETLEDSGFINRLADGRFQLGAAVFDLGMVYKATFQLEHLVQPVLESLSAATGESASFYVRAGDMRQCMWRVESTQSVRHVLRAGVILPIGDTSTGQVFRQFGGEAVPPAGDLKKAIRESARVDDDQTASISVPVFGSNGFVGAMSLSGPTGRFTRRNVAAMKVRLADAASGLSRQLGCPGL